MLLTTATTTSSAPSAPAASLARRLRRYGHAYREIFELLSAVQPKGLCLDLPAGEGANLEGIASAGFRPVGMDLYPTPVAGRDGEVVPTVQANWYSGLPFAEGSFGAVLCSEGIEHHAAQTEFLRELARVLRPGGTLVLTTPNVLSLGARWSTLLNGHSAHNRVPLTEATTVWRDDGDGRIPYIGHAHMVGYFALRFMLWRVGLHIERVATARWGRNSVVCAPLLWLPVCISTRRLLSRIRHSHPDVYAEILSHVLSPPLMLGKKLILVARKTGPPRF